MTEAHAAVGAEKYLVRRFGVRWRVTSGAGPPTTFASSEDAIREACSAARQTALAGRLGLVVTETSPQEFHCFMPLPGADGPRVVLPTFLRLIDPEV